MLNKKAKEQIKKAEEQIKEGYMYGVVGLVMAFVCAVLVCINYGLFDVFMKIFGICSCIMIIPAIIISVSGYIALKEAKNVLNASAGNTVDKDYIQQAVARWRLLLYLPIIGGGILNLIVICTCQQILDTKYQKIVSYIVRLYKPYATLDIAPRNAGQVMPTV